MRTGPGTDYGIIERILPGEAVRVSSARCGLDAFDMTLCTGTSSDWVFLDRKFAGAPRVSAGSDYKGWVNGIYLSEVPCLP